MPLLQIELTGLDVVLAFQLLASVPGHVITVLIRAITRLLYSPTASVSNAVCDVTMQCCSTLSANTMATMPQRALRESSPKVCGPSCLPDATTATRFRAVSFLSFLPLFVNADGGGVCHLSCEILAQLVNSHLIAVPNCAPPF
jgi:hypothetical protein